MKLVGHVYVATKAFPTRNKPLLALGSLLPEVVFYVDDPALDYDQIHEGGDKLYEFCQEAHPEYRDLAIGTMTHGYKYGVDWFNSVDNLKALGYSAKEDLPLIQKALGVGTDIAQIRAHNLYDLALDYYVRSRYPETLEHVVSASELDFSAVAGILAECYNRDYKRIKKNIEQISEIYDLKLVNSFKGLALLWKNMATNLPEKETMNIEATEALLSFFYDKLSPAAEDFLDVVVGRVKRKVGSIVD